MNWFDSRSFTGLLSQAQKSIDKVLDISTAEGSEKTGNDPLTLEERKSEDKNKASSSSSWISVDDSFWSSFSTKGSTDVDKKEPSKEKLKTARSTKNENSKTEKEKELLKKGGENLKRNNGRTRSSKKKKAHGDNLDQQSKEDGFTERIQDEDSGKQGELKDISNHLIDSVPKEEERKVKEGYMLEDTESVIDETEKNLKNPNGTVSVGLSKDGGTVEDVFINDELLELNKNDVCTESNCKANEDILTKENNEMSKEGVIVEDASNFKEVTNDKTGTKSQDIVNESVENESMISCNELDSLCSMPVATSTPCSVRNKETLMDNNELNEENKLTDYQDLLKASETQEDQSKYLDGIMHIEKETKGEHSNFKMPKFNVEEVNEGLDVNEVEVKDDEPLKKDNERLLQVVEIRESKLVELSKENLNIQEANTILRSQLEQMEEIHKSEDSEFEQMKEEFTKRISDSETKLQAAAKERDLYKRQLEETQKCLGSDNERQLKEFQMLSQEKDEQIVQLMEEGEKLSKKILQCNNNIKKLRVKEKETTSINETICTRLEAAESEIERLTQILKERDEHKKNQDDAINKVNVYIKKQDEQIAKQKVELEESSAKLPSLQTALDNAYKEVTELHKVNAAKSNEVQEATLSVEMTAKEEMRMGMEKIKKESQKECDMLAMEVTDLQTQLSRSEQQAARREDNLRQEISDFQLRLQEAETRNQELTQSVSIATRPLLRQIENIQHSYGSQQTSWEKLEKNLTERLAEAHSQQATAQEKERAVTERSLELNSRIASLESQVGNYRQEKSRIEAELEIEKAKSEALEEFKCRETGKIEVVKTMHSKQLGTMLVEKTLLEQQLAVEKTKFESEQRKLSRLQDQLKEKSPKKDIFTSKTKNEYIEENEDDVFPQTSSTKGQSRHTSTSSQFSFSDTINHVGPSFSGTAILEELHATIRHKEGELSSMQSAISTIEASRESLTTELTNLVATNEDLVKENGHVHQLRRSFQEHQTKYNALLQMYGEKQEETEELKLDLQDIKIMYKAQIQELLNAR